MANKGQQNKKGSRKEGRNYRLRGTDFTTTGAVTRYRAAHGIPQGRRKDIHARGDCPVHNKAA